jgi:Pretoxin HINT domain
MFCAILVCAACANLEPTDSVAGVRPEPGAMTAYEAARARAGRDADAHVRLALWCESHGLEAERLRHLAIAVLADPSHAAARGLMGLVAYRGGWRSPEAVSLQIGSDEALTSYNARRARMVDSADAHWKMAVWCEQQGLNPEATAHLTRVVQLEPGREAAWKHLGYRKQGRRWVTDEQIAAEKAEAEAQKEADRYWPPILSEWRRWIGDKARELELIEALSTVSEPRAVPSVWATFGRGKATHQKVAVQLLGQIDSPDATRALALLALDGKSPEVRARATQTLRVRDPRDVASLLVALLRDPQLDPDPILFHYQVRPIAWDALNAPGVLLVRGPRYDIVKTYSINHILLSPDGSSDLVPSERYVRAVTTQRERQIHDLEALVLQIRRESEEYLAFAGQHVEHVARSNARVIRTLNAATGQDRGEEKEAWRKWWSEERGYAYVPQPVQPVHDLTSDESKPTYFSHVEATSCFAAGTTVRTLAGPRPIESIAIGDQVLTQHTRSGVLGYHPVIAAPHNKPDRLYKIDLGRDAIKATGIHRFWKAGRGWVMARDLKPGDVIRTLGGVATVKLVERAGVEPVYNLKVLQAESYFVGETGLLVHDSSEVHSVTRPFDATSELVAAGR